MMMAPMHKGLEAPMNKQIETLDWGKLERLDWHLWLLATLLIFILGIGLLSFMFPTSFWFIGSTPAQQPQRAFFGFCILLGLVLVYLLQRQAALRGLKRQLFESQRAKAAAEHESILKDLEAAVVKQRAGIDEPRRRGARHRDGAHRDGGRAGGRHPGGHRLQPALAPCEAVRVGDGRFRHGVLEHL